MILAEREPASARVIAAVIFLVHFWIEPKMNNIARQYGQTFIGRRLFPAKNSARSTADKLATSHCIACGAQMAS